MSSVLSSNKAFIEKPKSYPLFSADKSLYPKGFKFKTKKKGRKKNFHQFLKIKKLEHQIPMILSIINIVMITLKEE